MQVNIQQNRVLTTPDDITRQDKDTIKAWITPAVSTNEGDPRVHQATKNITRQYQQKCDERTKKHKRIQVIGTPAKRR